MKEDESNLETLFSKFKNILSSNFNPDEILNTLKQVDDQATKVMKTFGASREFTLAIKDNLAGAVSDVRALGGEMSDVAKIQQDVGSALGRSFITTKDSIAQLYAAYKVTGVETERMVNAFKDAGISALNAGNNMEKVVKTAQSMGVNVGQTSAMVVSNMDLLNKYNFQGGVEGLAKMAAQAVNMRIDIQKLSTFMDKAFDPEKAIEMAAGLQRLGVTQSDLLDPLRLLDLAQNDPTELQNQVAEMTKSFVRMNEAGNFEIAPGGKRQLMEIAKEMQIPYETLTKMALSSFELEDKMKKIHFPSQIASDEDKKFIANLAESKGGEYVVSVFDKKKGEQVEKTVTELNTDDLAELRKMAQPKTMEELAKDQLNYQEQMTASLKSIDERVGLGLSRTTLGTKIAKAPADFAKIVEEGGKAEGLSSTAYKEMFNKNEKVLNALQKDYESGKLTEEKVSEAVKKIFHTAGETLKTGGEQFLFRSGQEMKKQGLISGNEAATNVDTRAVTPVQDAIKLPGQDVVPLPQDSIMIGTGLEQLINIMKNPMQSSQPSDMMTSSPKDVNVNVNFNGQNMPTGIDTDKLIISVKNDMSLRQAIVEAVQSTMANNNLTPKNSLPPQGSMFPGYMTK